MKSYWAASDDPVFEDGHYVEEWELRRLSQMSEPVRHLIRAQFEAGNKVRSITERSVELARPLQLAVLELPAGLAF